MKQFGRLVFLLLILNLIVACLFSEERGGLESVINDGISGKSSELGNPTRTTVEFDLWYQKHINLLKGGNWSNREALQLVDYLSIYGKFDDAIMLIDKYTPRFELKYKLLLARGILYELTGNKKLAEYSYQESIESQKMEITGKRGDLFYYIYTNYLISGTKGLVRLTFGGKPIDDKLSQKFIETVSTLDRRAVLNYNNLGFLNIQLTVPRAPVGQRQGDWWQVLPSQP